MALPYASLLFRDGHLLSGHGRHCLRRDQRAAVNRFLFGILGFILQFSGSTVDERGQSRPGFLLFSKLFEKDLYK